MKSYTKRILRLGLVVVAFGAGVAHAKECKGINFPDQAQVEGTTLALNGLGLRQATAFKINVYPFNAAHQTDIDLPADQESAGRPTSTRPHQA